MQWENTQLEYGRTGVPLCCYGDECEARSLENSPGPLHAYLSPDEQRAFDETGALPDPPGFCLLCIRRDSHAMALAYDSVVVDPKMQVDRSYFTIPPFQNLSACPGGKQLVRFLLLVRR